MGLYDNLGDKLFYTRGILHMSPLGAVHALFCIGFSVIYLFCKNALRDETFETLLLTMSTFSGECLKSAPQRAALCRDPRDEGRRRLVCSFFS